MQFPNIGGGFDWRVFASEMLRERCLSVEFQRKFHTEWTVQGHRIRSSIGNDALLAAVLRVGLPAYSGGPQVLFRGENIDRWISGDLGFCWSASQAAAVMFARGLNAISLGGVLLKVAVPAATIIAGPSEHSNYLGEDEFTVDPSRIEGVTEVRRFAPTH